MVTLIILDGFGERKETFGNAIKNNTPNIDKLLKKYPHTLLKASGEAVGLPCGQMGNSEVGHLTIGAGRVILQDLAHINNDIKDGKFKMPKDKPLKNKQGSTPAIPGGFEETTIPDDVKLPWD